MSAKAFFSDKTGECRLEINLPNGDVQGVRFEKTSSMVDYCNHFGIDVAEEDWRTEWLRLPCAEHPSVARATADDQSREMRQREDFDILGKYSNKSKDNKHESPENKR